MAHWIIAAASNETNPFQSVSDFFTSPLWHFILYMLIFFCVAIWLACAYWVFKDARRQGRGQDRARGLRAHRPRVRTARPHHLRHRAASRAHRRPSRTRARGAHDGAAPGRRVALFVLQDARSRRLPGLSHVRAPAAHHLSQLPQAHRPEVARLPVLRGGRPHGAGGRRTIPPTSRRSSSAASRRTRRHRRIDQWNARSSWSSPTASPAAWWARSSPASSVAASCCAA